MFSKLTRVCCNVIDSVFNKALLNTALEKRNRDEHILIIMFIYLFKK